MTDIMPNGGGFAPITIITPTIPGRESFLGVNMRSVWEQDLRVYAHLIHSDPPRPGMPGPVHTAHKQNELLAAVKTTWTVRLSDDDRLLSEYAETMMSQDIDGYDIVYPWEFGGTRPRIDVTGWPKSRLLEFLAGDNFADGSGALIRTELAKQAGGWPTEIEPDDKSPSGYVFTGYNAPWEDWAMWARLVQADARILCVPVELWWYNDGHHPRISNTEARWR